MRKGCRCSSRRRRSEPARGQAGALERLDSACARPRFVGWPPRPGCCGSVPGTCRGGPRSGPVPRRGVSGRTPVRDRPTARPRSRFFPGCHCRDSPGGRGRGDVGKRIDGADMRAQPAALDQGAQLVELAAVLPGEDEVIARVPAPGLEEVLRLGEVDDADHAAELREYLGAARQGVAADAVEHHVDAVASGFPQDGLDVVLLLVVDEHIGAHLAGELEVDLAHCGEDPGSHGLRQLDRDMPDAAGAAMHQDAFADPQRRACDQRFPGRAADQAEARRLQVAQRGGLPADDAFRCQVVLGIAALAFEDLRVYQTSSPGATAVTPGPTASTTPDTSCPVMAGSATRSG